MPVSEKKKASNAKWDAANMTYQTIKIRRALLDDFKKACSARGDRVNTVLCGFIQKYVDESQADKAPSEE